MAIVYQYDSNGFYWGESDDFNGPMPHNCANIKPEIKEGFIPQWNGASWQQVENHKGLKGWLNGEPYTIEEYGPLPDGFSIEQPAPTLEEKQAMITNAVQARLDAFAQTRGYDNILSAASYVTSTNPKFVAEGQYAVEVRDLTWAKCYEILNAVMAGQRPEPTSEEIMDELPELAWPGGVSPLTTG